MILLSLRRTISLVTYGMPFSVSCLEDKQQKKVLKVHNNDIKMKIEKFSKFTITFQVHHKNFPSPPERCQQRQSGIVIKNVCDSCWLPIFYYLVYILVLIPSPQKHYHHLFSQYQSLPHNFKMLHPSIGPLVMSL